MANYIQFETMDKRTLLVEVSEDEITSQRSGVQKAGLKEIASKTISVAQDSFEDALKYAIRSNAQVFLDAVRGLSTSPDEAEISFGLKMTGEAGNVAVAKIGGETNYNIRLTWRREEKGVSQDEH